MRNFRILYNYALEEGYVSGNESPFRHVHTRPCQTVKRTLSIQQMQKISLLFLMAGANGLGTRHFLIQLL